MTLRELAQERWLTVPNALSFVRLLGVPLFLWLLLGPQADGWALVVLVASGITDWLDGRIARALDQYSRLGELLDPLADRLYTVATLVAFLIRGIVPWWVLALIIGRDLVVSLALPLLRRKGYLAFPVLYIGKAATLNLLYAFPLLLLAQMDWPGAWIAEPVAYAFTAWGIALHLWSGALYLVQLVRSPVAAVT
ncbi:CDP-diacylglycerol--glycerol-3-phosphate 3-phosphatidyltransferase [Actinomycetospora sp. NBRC 106375]|uniref:CDP-alcohol phosphatidyltransferase family protein n=1 Tax=Actinomycetospora sp. NBRC 106375 TaxID=3032207 RepID=UPI0024A2ADAE|nr:CDP-alcohol phosphatidyltransferase family protein [Actinomycetospora sp. NBRC 106375]GLZ43828.1 CDP-diacylglycerol--glycerol-3-phosphate 3-phosphatidyltransferase [Actinomycetospora sp. NBRC 106375]